MRPSSAVVVMLMLATAPAAAQTAPNTKLLRVSFDGLVVDDVKNTIVVRGADGTLRPFTGPVPDYAYSKGDQVSISFDALVPTKGYYDAAGTPKSADGLYRFTLTGPNGTAGQLGNAQAVDVTGAIAADNRVGAGKVGISGLTVVYDANADSYSLELSKDGWRTGGYDAPTYSYDADSGALTSRANSCFTPQCEAADLAFRGDRTRATFGHGGSGAMRIANAAEPSTAGFFQLALTGLFNLPIFGGSSGGGTGNPGDPVSVPEPGTLTLFGLGAAAMAWRRRRSRHA